MPEFVATIQRHVFNPFQTEGDHCYGMREKLGFPNFDQLNLDNW